MGRAPRLSHSRLTEREWVYLLTYQGTGLMKTTCPMKNFWATALPFASCSGGKRPSGMRPQMGGRLGHEPSANPATQSPGSPCASTTKAAVCMASLCQPVVLESALDRSVSLDLDAKIQRTALSPLPVAGRRSVMRCAMVMAPFGQGFVTMSPRAGMISITHAFAWPSAVATKVSWVTLENINCRISWAVSSLET